MEVEGGRPTGMGDLRGLGRRVGLVKGGQEGIFVSSLPVQRPKLHISTLQGQSAAEKGRSGGGRVEQKLEHQQSPLTGAGTIDWELGGKLRKSPRSSGA